MNYFNRLVRFLPLIVLTLLTIFVFRDILFKNQIIASDISLKYAPLSLTEDIKNYSFDSQLRSDMLDGYYPIAKNIADQIKQNHGLPIWDNSVKFGAPVNLIIIGIPMLNYLAAYVSLPILTTIFVFIKFILSLLFTYLLARKLQFTKIASTYTSIVYTLSGFNIVWIWGSATTISLLIPMLLYGIILTFRQKKVILGSLITYWALFIMIWSGFISGFAFALYFIGPIYLFLCIKKFSKGKKIMQKNYFVFPILLGISITSILFILIPSLNYLSHINIEYRGEINAKAHLDLREHLIQLFVPLYNGGESLKTLNFDYTGPINYNESSGYIGTVGYFFFFIGVISLSINKFKNKIINYFLVTWLLSLLIIYDIGPFNSVVSQLPLLNNSSSTRLLMINAFVAAFISGFGFNAVLVQEKYFSLIDRLKLNNKKYIFVLTNTFFIITIGIWIFLYKFTLVEDNYKNITRLETFKLIIIIISILVFSYLSVLTLISLFTKTGKYFYGLCIIAFISAELLFYTTGQLPTIKKDFFYPVSNGTQYLIDNTTDQDRVLVLGAVYGSRGTELFYKFSTPFPHTLYSQSEIDLMEELFKDDKKIFASKTLPFNHPDNIHYDSNILDLINVKYLVFHPLQRFSDEDLKSLNENFEQVYKNDNDLMIYKNKEGNSLIHTINEDDNITAKIITFTDTYQKITINSKTNTTLYLTLANYEGWDVKVNGVENDIKTIDSLWRGVDIPEGESTVEFSYNKKRIEVYLEYFSFLIIISSIIITLTYVALRIYIVRDSFISKIR